MDWEIEVRFRPGARDVHGKGILHEVRDLGIARIKGVESARLFYLDTSAPRADVERIARELLTDPVVEEYRISDGAQIAAGKTARRANRAVAIRLGDRVIGGLPDGLALHLERPAPAPGILR